MFFLKCIEAVYAVFDWDYINLSKVQWSKTSVGQFEWFAGYLNFLVLQKSRNLLDGEGAYQNNKKIIRL